MKRKIEWLQFGQFLTMVVNLWTMIKQEFTNRKIGPEILEWLNGDGRAYFQNELLPTLSEEYLRFLERERQKARPQPQVADVDLDVEPELPFDGARLTKNTKLGKVRVEYRPDEDELYVNGRKVVPWLSDEQRAGGVILGRNLQPKAEKNNPLNATLADWLYENQAFIPKKWQGRIWYFWGSEWSVFDGRRCVRYLYWDGALWYRSYYWLVYGWNAYAPSASLAS